MKYTQDQLTELFTQAVNLFNETMGEEYKVGDDGIILCFASSHRIMVSKSTRISTVHIFRTI